VRAARFRPPVTLEGQYVRLLPLEPSHAPSILEAAGDPDVQRYLGRPVGTTLPEVEATIEFLLEKQASGTDLPFATSLRANGAVVGMTRFLRLDPENDTVDIGGTFLARRFWRTPLNTDAKLAMLRYAFDEGGAHRVSLQTDLRNERSQAAIARLGAVREGILREDRHLPDGYRRSSVIFSILVGEWPSVCRRLEAALAPPWSPTVTPRGTG
jgi:RimJ/RimL family protein N-acetyltransferase